MNPIQLAGLVKRFYPNFDMTKFSDRLKLQKLIYLMQPSGLNLGYNFRLYLRGPYSTQLARDGFDMPNFESIDSLKFEDVALETLFTKLDDYLKDKKDDQNIMEILGSLHIFHVNSPTKTDDELIKAVKEKNTNLNEDKIKEELNSLKKFEEIKW